MKLLAVFTLYLAVASAGPVSLADDRASNEIGEFDSLANRQGYHKPDELDTFVDEQDYDEVDGYDEFNGYNEVDEADTFADDEIYEEFDEFDGFADHQDYNETREFDDSVADHRSSNEVRQIAVSQKPLEYFNFQKAQEAANYNSTTLRTGKYYLFMFCRRRFHEATPEELAEAAGNANESREWVRNQTRRANSPFGCGHVGLVVGKVTKVPSQDVDPGCLGCSTKYEKHFEAKLYEVILDVQKEGAKKGHWKQWIRPWSALDPGPREV